MEIPLRRQCKNPVRVKFYSLGCSEAKPQEQEVVIIQPWKGDTFLCITNRDDCCVTPEGVNVFFRINPEVPLRSTSGYRISPLQGSGC